MSEDLEPPVLGYATPEPPPQVDLMEPAMTAVSVVLFTGIVLVFLIGVTVG